jgi:hypothetical protein
MFIWDAEKGSWWKLVWLVPMGRAAQIAFDKAHGTPFAEMVHDSPSVKEGSLAAHADSIADGAAIYGYRPNAGKIRRISDDDAKSFHFSDDGNTLVNVFNEKDRYIKTAIRRRDLRKWVKTIRGDG